ncbi:hypothetical protein E2C01_096334 [Portunus trituberculatus]|uniref:Uncharacterized protein n=1 Tax=Portunus trituberculatus TaxID=210409 RepID=A0A5B7JXP2_PORTR|nr:hypothetical protein [Portunus trituberculatus]
MSTVTRFKQSVCHGKECKPQQPSPASAWATPRSVLTCTAYICLMTPSALGVGLPLRPWNIFCSNATLPLSPHRSMLTALCPGHHNIRPAHPPGGLRRPPLLATCCPSPYLCLLEEDQPSTTPVIPHTGLPQVS